MTEVVTIDKLTPDERNANQGTKRGLDLLDESLRQNGAGRSVLLDKHNRVIAGNKTVERAADIGIDNVIVVDSDGSKLVAVRRTDLDLETDEAARRMAYADNRVGQIDLAWDASQIAADLEAGLDLTGLFYPEELSAILEQAADDLLKGDTPVPEPQLDRAKELQEQWATATGQLWELGKHRLICGDCTDGAIVERVMGPEKAQLLFTSPPYWVGKDYETQTSLAEVRQFIDSCAAIWTSYTNGDGGRIIINCSTASAKALNPKADTETLFTLTWWQDAMRRHDWLMRHCRIWLKHGDMAAPHVAAKSDVVDQHWETIPEFLPTFYYPDGLRRGQEKIGMKWAQLGVWDDIPGERSAGGLHCAAFPVELPDRYLRLYTMYGETVLEPFSGSGTTIVACERLGRKCRAIEISPAYVAVALERWKTMTGLEPRLL